MSTYVKKKWMFSKDTMIPLNPFIYVLIFACNSFTESQMKQDLV